MDINMLATFGDQRRMILDVINSLRTGEMDIGRGMAIAANMKVLNDSIQVEINAAKMVILAKEGGYDFGRMVAMGKKIISNIENQES